MTEWTQEIGDLQSINSDKQLPQSLFTSNFFRWRHFALTSMSLIFLSGGASSLKFPYIILFVLILVSLVQFKQRTFFLDFQTLGYEAIPNFQGILFLLYEKEQ
jgi:hypothetical protein